MGWLGDIGEVIGDVVGIAIPDWINKELGIGDNYPVIIDQPATPSGGGGMNPIAQTIGQGIGEAYRAYKYPSVGPFPSQLTPGGYVPRGWVWDPALQRWKRSRRRRRRLLTNTDFNDLLRISNLPNSKNVAIALSKAIR